MTLSLRAKLTLWYIGTVVALLATFVGADVVGLRSNLLRQADGQLRDTSEVLTHSLAEAPAGWHQDQGQLGQARRLLETRLAGKQAWSVLLLDGGDPPPTPLLTYPTATPTGSLPRWERCPPAAAPDTIAEQQLAGVGAIRCLTTTATDRSGSRYVLKIALSVESTMATWRHAIWEHGVLMIILVVLVSFVGYGFIRVVFRPVRRLVRTARAITADDLSLRVDDPGDQDEIGELARTLNGMIARLEHSFTQVQRFSGDASHELNTPLTVLRGELEVALRRQRTPEEYHRLLERLLGEVKRLSGIVNDLLFLSRADAHRLDEPVASVALDRVVLEAFEEAAALAKDCGVVVALRQVDEITVPGTASLVNRVVANLLDNAIKFSPSGETVTVVLERRERGARLAISDAGPGIPEGDSSRIFDRFYRADPSRSKQSGGVGLGLAIVREIADLHEIDLRIDSEPGGGTTATVIWRLD